MINNDKNVLDIDIFIKLIRVTQDFSNFKSHQTLFLHSSYLFT